MRSHRLVFGCLRVDTEQQQCRRARGTVGAARLRELGEARGDRSVIVRVREPPRGGVGALQPQRAAELDGVLRRRAECGGLPRLRGWAQGLGSEAGLRGWAQGLEVTQ